MSSLKRLSLKVSALNFCQSPSTEFSQKEELSHFSSFHHFFFLKKRTNAKGEQLTFDLRQRVATEVVQRLTYQSSFNQHGCRARQHCSTSTHTHFISMWRETHMTRKTAKKWFRWFWWWETSDDLRKWKKCDFNVWTVQTLCFSSLQKLNYIYLIHLSLYR